MIKALGRWTALVIGLGAALPSAAAGVVVYDQTGLTAALARGAYCCVVDARSDSERKRDPVDQAVLYRKGLKVTPSAAVVVIADSEAEGLRIGKLVARDNQAKDVFVVKGGAGVWRASLATAQGAPPSSMTFVIPKNTCEQGKPLQSLKSDRP